VTRAFRFNPFPLEDRRERDAAHSLEALARRLHGFLPLSARCRPPLLGMLHGHAPRVTASTRLLVTGVFVTGGGGLMCKIDLDCETIGSSVLVVPITHLAFDRRHPIWRDVATYRRRHATRFESNGSRK